jgi:protein-L-isoaspartate(D-aspartate) O-methyltransferase
MEQHGANNSDVLALNQVLIGELKSKGCIQMPHVEAAFRAVLRHLFVPRVPLEEVYSDRAIPSKQDQNGQWLSSSSQPAIMAIMLEQLGLEPGHKVLEIGTGTGYNAALIAHIIGEAGHVVTVDIDESLVGAARRHLAMAGFDQVQVICTDGGYGYPDAAPYDRIILTVGASDIAPAWWDQMKPGGRIVLPLTLKGSQKSIAFEQANDHLASISVRDCSFMPLRGDFASSPPNQVQLGPDPGLYVEPVDKFSIDSDAAYGLLTGTSKDWAASVEVTACDVMMGKLWTWLALHEPQMCQLVAEGDVVERGIVPPLIGLGGKQKSACTVVLLDETGLVALMRPPGQSVPLVDINELFVSDSPFVLPFALFVRQFGPDESVAQRLIAQIQAWDTAGRPSPDGMHVRAYPKDFDYTPSEVEFVVEKPWTRLVLEWPAAV